MLYLSLRQPQTSKFRKKGGHRVSRKVNEKFLDAYIELDKACCEKFGIPIGGVTEYINRLGGVRFAPNREEVLPSLVKYRNVRNMFAHEPSAIKKYDDISKSDILWIKHFLRDLKRKKDPISAYLRKARRYARHRRIRRYIIAGAAVAALFIVVLVFSLLAK